MGLRHHLAVMTQSKTKIRVLTSIAGSVSAKPGQVIECDTVFALRLIDTGQAEHVDIDKLDRGVEAATTAPPETATRSRARSRKRRGVKRG